MNAPAREIVRCSDLRRRPDDALLARPHPGGLSRRAVDATDRLARVVLLRRPRRPSPAPPEPGRWPRPRGFAHPQGSSGAGRNLNPSSGCPTTRGRSRCLTPPGRQCCSSLRWRPLDATQRLSPRSAPPETRTAGPLVHARFVSVSGTSRRAATGGWPWRAGRARRGAVRCTPTFALTLQGGDTSAPRRQPATRRRPRTRPSPSSSWPRAASTPSASTSRWGRRSVCR